MYESGKKPNKPIKLYLNTAALSASKKALNTNDLNKDNYESSENDIRKIHESQLLKIQQLEKELKQIENQNELVSNEMKVLTSEQNKLSDKYNKIIKEIDFEKINLEKIKDINRLKNHEYLQKLRIKEELDNKENVRYEQNGENNSNTNSNDNDENRFTEALNGFNFLLSLSRFRRMAAEEEEEDDNDNNEDNDDGHNDEGPPLTYNQLQSLPCSKYLKKDNSTEKCIICEFEFCYNDEVTTLKCNHSFHKNCIINRLRARNSSKCPNCRISII
jgi:hypothetical protein